MLVTGGNRQASTQDNAAALPAELWTPPAAGATTGTWTTMNAMTKPRLYHSTAVLLPDATVLSTGGGQGGEFADHSDYEIFTPPYLCKGRARPQISSAPQAVVYGQTFIVQSPQATAILQSGRATLVRLSSVTHSFNMNQRFLELTRTAGPAANQLALTVPGSPNECPPGHYMLFLLDGNGTPSYASIVAIAATACATELTITQTSPNPVESYNTCSRTTVFTASGGPAGSAYVWTVNGTSYGTTRSSNSISLVTTTAAHAV